MLICEECETLNAKEKEEFRDGIGLFKGVVLPPKLQRCCNCGSEKLKPVGDKLPF